MNFQYDVVWQPVARRKYLERYTNDEPFQISGEFEWKPLPTAMYPTYPLDQKTAKEFADNLSIDQACDVHVWSDLAPGTLWYHSYLDGRRGDGWPSEENAIAD